MALPAEIRATLLEYQAKFDQLPLMWRMMLTMIIVGFLVSQIGPLARGFGNIMMRYFGEQMKYEAKMAMLVSAVSGAYYWYTTPKLYIFIWYVVSILATGVVTDTVMRVSQWATGSIRKG